MKECGHRTHVGTCSPCQRAQLARFRAQLREATRDAERWAREVRAELAAAKVVKT